MYDEEATYQEEPSLSEAIRQDERNAKLEAEDYGICEHCGIGHYHYRVYCGAKVCDECDHHKGLAKCYCGWGMRRGETEATLDADADIDDDYGYDDEE